jgi:hypothetical protein
MRYILAANQGDSECFTVKMKAAYSSEKTVFRRTTWRRHTQGDSILHRLRLFEKWVLRGICGSKRDGVTAVWRKLHNEELHDLYSPLSIIRIIKSMRMRWACNVNEGEEERV